MKKTHPELGRAFVFAGLTAALEQGIIGSCCYRRQAGAVTTTQPRQISRIEMLDAQARPHFDEARRNIPSVVDEMTGTGALCKLCWLMSRDKVTGSHKTQDYLESMLTGPIVGPCRAGAKVYGCNITAAGFVNGMMLFLIPLTTLVFGSRRTINLNRNNQKVVFNLRSWKKRGNGDLFHDWRGKCSLRILAR
jgi:hypothetical protein